MILQVIYLSVFTLDLEDVMTGDLPKLKLSSPMLSPKFDWRIILDVSCLGRLRVSFFLAYENKTTKITNLTISCFVEKRVSISWATSWYQDVVKYTEQSLYKSANQFVFLKCLDKTFNRGIIGEEETMVCGKNFPVLARFLYEMTRNHGVRLQYIGKLWWYGWRRAEYKTHQNP